MVNINYSKKYFACNVNKTNFFIFLLYDSDGDDNSDDFCDVADDGYDVSWWCREDESELLRFCIHIARKNLFFFRPLLSSVSFCFLLLFLLASPYYRNSCNPSYICKKNRKFFFITLVLTIYYYCLFSSSFFSVFFCL